MIGDIDLYGVYLPSLFVWMLLALVLTLAARRLLAHGGFYRLVWHRPLFDFSLYVLLLGLVVTVTAWLSL